MIKHASCPYLCNLKERGPFVSSSMDPVDFFSPVSIHGQKLPSLSSDCQIMLHHFGVDLKYLLSVTDNL